MIYGTADSELRWGGHGIAGPIEPWRIENLLRTRRPGPSNDRDWSARVRYLVGARRHAAPDLADRIEAEVRAMFDARDAYLERRRAREREHVDADTVAMNSCPLRDPSVRGLTPQETAARRLCWLDGKPLPERRQRWCSDACVLAWGRNHEWAMASRGRRITDGDRCVRCGSEVIVRCSCGESWPESENRQRTRVGGRYPHDGHELRFAYLEVNHRDPRRGRGYHQGCHNHQDGLETLCKPCHQAETNAQRAAG